VKVAPTCQIARRTLVQALDDLRVVFDLGPQACVSHLRTMRKLVSCGKHFGSEKPQYLLLASAQLTRCIMAHRPILDMMNSPHTTAMEALQCTLAVLDALRAVDI
jgi:hypothetical protein